MCPPAPPFFISFHFLKDKPTQNYISYVLNSPFEAVDVGDEVVLLGRGLLEVRPDWKQKKAFPSKPAKQVGQKNLSHLINSYAN